MKKKLQFIFCLILTTTFNCILSQAQTLTLTPSNYNGFNVSCFGGNDGEIDLAINGGTPPYTIEWSNGIKTEDISGLTAGYYSVRVDDSDSLTPPVQSEITLIEPRAMNLVSEIPKYPNGYNISLYGACNASINLTITEGVGPYTCLWQDGVTTQNRTSVCYDRYLVTIIDNNGCKIKSEPIVPIQPDRSDWQMTGNNSINPSINFLGTLDNNDLKFKTNNLERMTLDGNGDLYVSSLSGMGTQMIIATNDGKLILAPCSPWSTCGNDLTTTEYFGSNNNVPVIFKANSQEIFRLKTYGKVSIKEFENQTYGLLYSDNLEDINKIDFDYLNPTRYLDATGNWSDLPAGSGIWNLNGNHAFNVNTGSIGIGINTPSTKLEIAHNTTVGNPNGITLHNFSTTNLNSEIKFKQNNVDLWAFGVSVQHNNINDFFIYDNQANATRFIINANGKVGIGTASPNQALEVAHDNSHGGISINRLNSSIAKSQISFQQNGAEKYSIGTDIGENGSDNFYIYHGPTGVARLFVNSTGYVGVGNSNPTTKLDVTGKGKFDDVQINSLSGTPGKLLQVDANGNVQVSSVSSSTANLWNNNGNSIYNNSTNVFIGMSNCGTGCIDPDYKLYVEGGIAAREVKVTANIFPDYVFEKDYILRTIYELEKYIKENGHLPEMPSAKEVSENNGFGVSDMILKLIKQNEEQALYIINLQKEIDTLKVLIENISR